MNHRRRVEYNQLPYGEDLEDVENWSDHDEACFQYALLNRRPVGPNREQEVNLILARFMDFANKRTTQEVIWKKLRTFYNFEELEYKEELIAQAEMDAINREIIQKKEKARAVAARKRRSERESISSSVTNSSAGGGTESTEDTWGIRPKRDRKSLGTMLERSDRSSSCSEAESRTQPRRSCRK